jgi:hypothetical protein
MARQKLLDGLPVGLFRPDESDMLHAWMTDGKRYTAGERLPSVNYEMHSKSNQLWLTDTAAHYIRHIVYCYKLAPSRFPSLMNYFSALMLGRPLAQQEFPSASTLRSRFTRLHLIDSHRFAAKFEIYITGLGDYGFHRLWSRLQHGKDTACVEDRWRRCHRYKSQRKIGKNKPDFLHTSSQRPSKKANKKSRANPRKKANKVKLSDTNDACEPATSTVEGDLSDTHDAREPAASNVVGD